MGHWKGKPHMGLSMAWLPTTHSLDHRLLTTLPSHHIICCICPSSPSATGLVAMWSVNSPTGPLSTGLHIMATTRSSQHSSMQASTSMLKTRCGHVIFIIVSLAHDCVLQRTAHCIMLQCARCQNDVAVKSGCRMARNDSTQCLEDTVFSTCCRHTHTHMCRRSILFYAIAYIHDVALGPTHTAMSTPLWDATNDCM